MGRWPFPGSRFDKTAPTAITRATTISIVATAKLVRIPVEAASGRAVAMSLVADATANTAPISQTKDWAPSQTLRASAAGSDSNSDRSKANAACA